MNVLWVQHASLDLLWIFVFPLALMTALFLLRAPRFATLQAFENQQVVQLIWLDLWKVVWGMAEFIVHTSFFRSVVLKRFVSLLLNVFAREGLGQRPQNHAHAEEGAIFKPNKDAAILWRLWGALGKPADHFRALRSLEIAKVQSLLNWKLKFQFYCYRSKGCMFCILWRGYPGGVSSPYVGQNFTA